MKWPGMNVADGTHIDELEHLRQSCRDILTTPLGTRVMRREYGSYLADLIDQPINSPTRQRIFAAAVMALHRWEPRLRINRITVQTGSAPGQLAVELDAVRVDGARRRNLAPIIVQIRGMQ